ncbi:MAG: SDR family NAD(P)-dependent oxidoreductase [Pseudomonadota bacterium]
MGERIVIIGAGSGLSASLARLTAREGFQVALAARNSEKLAGLATEIAAKTYSCDATDEGQVRALFDGVEQDLGGTPDWVVYNASARTRGPFAELDRAAVRNAIDVSAWAAFLVAREAVPRMLARPGGASGSLFFTGASAAVKGYKQSASFAMGKFAQRGLAQSLARELSPQNIHIAHVVIDGAIANAEKGWTPDPAKPDSLLEPDAIAQSYLDLHRQHRSAWAWELELRPWVETF